MDSFLSVVLGDHGPLWDAGLRPATVCPQDGVRASGDVELLHDPFREPERESRNVALLRRTHHLHLGASLKHGRERNLGRRRVGRDLGRPGAWRRVGRRRIGRDLGRPGVWRLVGPRGVWRHLGRPGAWRLVGPRGVWRHLGRPSLAQIYIEK